ncbi:MAG: oligosaccharide flippase family protein, partial [Bacteroidales bacterium]
RPRLVFKTATIKRLFGFSSYLLLSQLVGIVQNMYSMMLGKHFSVTAVGYYTQAQKMSDMAISTINSPIQSSLFPVLSSINREEDRLLNAFRKSMHFACFLSFLFLPMLAITSKPFILMFLRNKWFDSIVFLQILSICGILSIITALVNTFLRVEGKSKHLLFVETIKAVITFSVLIATIPYGAIAVVIGQLVSRFLICIFSMYMTALKTNYSMSGQMKDISSYVFIATLSFLICYPVSCIITNIYLLFLIQNAVYLVAFAALNYLNKNVIMADIIELMRNKIKK